MDFKEPKQLEQEGKPFNNTISVGTLEPVKNKDKTYLLYDDFGQNGNTFWQFQANLRCGDDMVRLKAFGETGKTLGEVLESGQCVKVIGMLDEYYNENKKLSNRSIKVLKTDNVSSVNVNATDVDMDVKGCLAGYIRGISDTADGFELLLVLPGNEGYQDTVFRIQCKNDNSYTKWIKDNLSVGDYVKLTVQHIQRIVWDELTRVKNLENNLSLRTVENYFKVNSSQAARRRF